MGMEALDCLTPAWPFTAVRLVQYTGSRPDLQDQPRGQWANYTPVPPAIGHP